MISTQLESGQNCDIQLLHTSTEPDPPIPELLAWDGYLRENCPSSLRITIRRR
jgi:hypothetical protein